MSGWGTGVLAGGRLVLGGGRSVFGGGGPSFLGGTTGRSFLGGRSVSAARGTWVLSLALSLLGE